MEAIASGMNDKAAVVEIVVRPVGAEYLSEEVMKSSPPDDLLRIRGENIKSVLEGKLGPRDTRQRSHRKNDKATNGCLSFLELGELMKTTWKNCDSYAKNELNKLSEISREDYRRRMDEYIQKRKELGIDDVPAKSKQSVEQQVMSQLPDRMMALAAAGRLSSIEGASDGMSGAATLPKINMNMMQGFPPGMGVPGQQQSYEHHQQQQQQQQWNCSPQEFMLAHALEIEASQMLRSRVRELELQLTLQKAREDRIKAQFQTYEATSWASQASESKRLSSDDAPGDGCGRSLSADITNTAVANTAIANTTVANTAVTNKAVINTAVANMTVNAPAKSEEARI